MSNSWFWGGKGFFIFSFITPVSSLPRSDCGLLLIWWFVCRSSISFFPNGSLSLVKKVHTFPYCATLPLCCCDLLYGSFLSFQRSWVPWMSVVVLMVAVTVGVLYPGLAKSSAWDSYCCLMCCHITLSNWSWPLFLGPLGSTSPPLIALFWTCHCLRIELQANFFIYYREEKEMKKF